MKMNPRVKVLKQLVADEHYVIDERAIADAVLVASTTLRVLPDVTFRRAPHAARQVRSSARAGAPPARVAQRRCGEVLRLNRICVLKTVGAGPPIPSDPIPTVRSVHFPARESQCRCASSNRRTRSA